MRVMLAAAAFAAFAGAPALAADLPAEAIAEAVAVPSFSWTGGYVGVFAGVGFASESFRIRDVDGYNGFGSYRSKADAGFTGGLTLGYNYQFEGSPAVIGLEGELGYLNLGAKRRDPGGPGGDTRFKGEWDEFYGTLNGRLGFAFDRFLVYGKAGVAYLDTKAKVSDGCDVFPCGPLTVSASKGGDEWHWTVGGGIEVALTDQISIKGEYTYIATGDTLRVRGTDSAGIDRTFRTKVPDVHIVKAGLNYRFNW